MLANIYSGANRESCARCRALYEQHPSLLEAKRTVRYIERALRLDAQGQYAKTLAVYARRVGKSEEIRPVFEELIADLDAKTDARSGRRAKRFRKGLAVLLPAEN